MKRFLDWFIFSAFVLGLAALLTPMWLGNAVSVVIVDGRSMEPTYEHGDLVIARGRSTYQAGDVITYDAPVGQTYRVIHRITEVTDDGYITQGDNRDEADGWVVPFDAVHGSSWLHIPHGGTVALMLRQPAVLIGLVAGWLTLALMTRREKRKRETAVSDDPAANDALAAGTGAAATRTPRLASVALFGGMTVIGLAAGFIVASAATLVVDGGVLQAFTQAGPELDLDGPTGSDPDADTAEDLEVALPGDVDGERPAAHDDVLDAPAAASDEDEPTTDDDPHGQAATRADDAGIPSWTYTPEADGSALTDDR